MTFYSLFPGFNLAYIFVNLPYGLHRISMKMAPMQQDLFYSIIVLQDAVKLSLITETMFILKTMICLSRNILLKVNISIPGTFMKGWNFFIDLTTIANENTWLLREFGIDFHQIVKHYCPEESTYISPAPAEAETIFKKTLGAF